MTLGVPRKGRAARNPLRSDKRDHVQAKAKKVYRSIQRKSSALGLIICLLDALNFAPRLPLSDPKRTLDLELKWKLAVGQPSPP